MKITPLTVKSFLLSLLVTAVAVSSRADLVGPYTPDANTLFLLHFDEPAGTSVATNSGSKGGRFYSVNQATASTTPPVVTTMLGAPGYVSGLTNFNLCMTNPTPGYLFGYDFNNNGAYQGDQSGSALSADALAMTNLNIGLGGQSPFTIEALIRPTTISGVNQEIVCTDSSSGTRGFQFRITSGGQLNFQFINGNQAISGTIPTTGTHAFVAGNWYHVAMTYDGSIATLYWTKLDPSIGAANVLSTASITLGATQGNTTGPLCIANENRNNAGEIFSGAIDEVVVSNVRRKAGEMAFFSQKVTITQNPVSQNVDYNQPVTFVTGGSSSSPRQELALSYQWRFNSNTIVGATNSAYVITNVAANNAGAYDCVVTNTAGFAATSSPALLVVGAANFLANRYSFTTDTSDSVGGQWGTNFGNATVTGGKLVLDGTTDTFMQLPGNLFNGGNATALTVEFWATYGVNPNFTYTFAFGLTNFVIGSGIVGFNHAMYTHHNGGNGQTASATPGDPTFAQTVTAPGTLDGRTVHVAVVFDPPNKTLSIYTNGVLQAVNTNFTVNISSLNNQLSYIGKSLWPADPYLNASIDEIRIFRGALSPITIKQSDDQGPNTLLADGPAKFVLNPLSTAIPVGQPVSFSAAAVGYLPITYQWFKNGSLVAGATNATYSLASTTLGDNGSTIVCWATNTIGVTTYVTNSTTATLTVFTPPTLAWLGAIDNQWNTTSINWTNNAGGGPLAFSQTNAVLFDARGSGQSTIDLVQDIVAAKVTVNAATDYTLTSSGANGSLQGAGNLLKQNTGRLILDITNNLTGGVTVSGGVLQVGNASASGSLGSGPVTNNATITFNRSDAVLNVANAITGSGGLTFEGTGSVAVSGSNDYSGVTTISSGVLNLQNAAGLGLSSAGTTVAAGGQLYITANVDVAEPLSVSGTGDGTGALRKGGAGVTALKNPVTLVTDTMIGVDGGATLNLSNTLAGAAVLTINANANGTLALSAANTYSGGTVLSSGIVNVNHANGLGTGAVTANNTGRFVIAPGITVTNAFSATVVSPGVATGFLMTPDNTNGLVTTVSGPVHFEALASNGGHFVGPTSSGYLNLAGPVTMPGAGSGYILAIRFGDVRFSGGGSGYDGIEVRANRTSLGANNGIATSATMDLAGNGSTTVPTYFDLNGFSQKLAGLRNAIGPANLAVVTNSSATQGTLTLDLGGSPQSFSGSIAGNLALRVDSGTQTLTGTNSYTGNTTIAGGLLQLSNESFGSGSTVSIANGALLQLDYTTTNRISALVLGGLNQPAGVYNSTTSPSYIAGSGNLLVAPIATNPTNITAAVTGGGAQYDLSWPATHKGWRLQAQTNALSVGLGATWFDVAGSTATNHVIIPINPANGAVFFRLVYP